MPADIDVLLGGSSPITFSSNYLSYPSESRQYNDTCDLLGSSNPLDFATALSNSPKASQYLSQSPPIIGNSPPTHFTFHGRCSSPTLRPAARSPSITLSRNFSQLRLANTESEMPVAVPRRPCLVVRCDVLDLPSPSKHKKRVVFADDRGFPLALVRTMTEPSNMPPRWSFQFLSQVTQGASEEMTTEPWEIKFPQPASDYLDFRRRLDSNKVCLENVIVKECEQAVLGTVKVRNLAFHKEIFVRTTSDDWETQEDAYCTYVPSSPPVHGVTVLYDTFSFRLTLPPRSRKLQFCVCFRCDGLEYWDNNFGKNYVIVKKDPPAKDPVKEEVRDERKEKIDKKKISLSRRFSDEALPTANFDSWSEFATWNHLTNNGPYW